jgi:hypothetical protein
MGTLERAIIWKNLQVSGSDYCEVRRITEGWVLKGIAIAVLDEHRPMQARYEVQCDHQWRTSRVQVSRTIGNDTRTLSLESESAGKWRDSSQEFPALRNCIDVDLGVTPATNTLPIRRLNLRIGQSQSITAAWITFPDLVVRPLLQKYTRLAKDRYHYESATGFSAQITVDDFGLAILYPTAWERVASV